MSWSDAARAAALRARRAHMGKRITPRNTLYHGGPIGIRGTHLRPGQDGKVFSTTNLQQALRYRENYRAPERGGAIFVVARPKRVMEFDQHISKLRSLKGKARRLFLKTVAAHEQHSVFAIGAPVKVLHRLPRAKGRASRGKY